MRINDEEATELINIDGWAILGVLTRNEGSGVSHLQCDSWSRYSMRPNTQCGLCGTAVPDEVQTIWLLLNSDKPAAESYYKELV